MATHQVHQSIEKPEPRTPSGQHAVPAKVPLERMGDGKLRFRGCSSIKSYEILEKLGEGTFGEVYKAKLLSDGHVVALKKILMHHEKDGFPITALREIKLLKMLSHPNILKLEEMAVERTKGEGRKKAIMYMVTPYMDHDLSGLLENPKVEFSEPQIKCYMLQLLEGLRYLHANKILHRDMKAANLLINNSGILQIADFGLARPYDDPAPRPGNGGGEARRDYTTLVVTRWYRPPELLLQLRRYTTAIDMWGVGCVFGEMFKGKPILAGTSDLNQANMIFDLVGSPTEENMPGWSSLPGCEGVRAFSPRPSMLAHVFRQEGSSAISLLSELLKLDWRKRINAIDALKHPYFTNHPLPARPGDIPRFEDSHELDRRKFRGQKLERPPAPAGGSAFRDLEAWGQDFLINSNNTCRGAMTTAVEYLICPRIIDRQAHRLHLLVGRTGLEKQTVFLHDHRRATSVAGGPLAGRVTCLSTALGHGCHHEVCRREVDEGKWTLTFPVMPAGTMDLEVVTTVKRETKEGIERVMAIEGRSRLESRRDDGVEARTSIAKGSVVEKDTDVEARGDGEAGQAAKDGVIDNNSTAPRGPAPDRTKHEGSSSDCGSPSPHVQEKQ
ncbi:MAG: hypothetical protein Q9206_002190 [Seirophora lacunosa]